MKTRNNSNNFQKIYFSSEIFIKVFSFIFLFVTTITSSAQMVGNAAYIKGTYVELGINGAGGYEGVDVLANPPLTGMHFRSNTDYFGFVANPQMNNWNTFDGDFFTPGMPENGWGITIGQGTNNNGNNCATYGGEEIPGAITNWSHIFDCYSVNWEGNLTSGTNLHVKINYLLQENALYYTTTVSVTNNTSSAIPEMYYYRNVDPDNNIMINGSDYYTRNTVVSQPGTNSCIIAHVSATQNVPWNSYMGFAAAGLNWRASYGGFSNTDGYELWNNTMGFYTQATGITANVDDAISLSYKIQNLAPGQTETFKFVVILDGASSANAINNLMYLSYPGSTYTPPAMCTTNLDTVTTCGGPVPIQIQGSAVNDYTWSWSPTAGLTPSTGPVVSADPLVTTTYTVTGTPLVSCLNPVNLSIVVKVSTDTGTVLTIDPVDSICVSSSAFNLTANLPGGYWSGDGITDAALGTFNPSVAGIGNHAISYLIPSTCNNPDTIIITVVGGSTGTITQPPTSCTSQAPFNLSASLPGGIWSGTGITNQTLGTFNPALSGAGNFVISYNISAGCPYTGSVTVSVNQSPIANAGPDITVCQMSTTLQANPSVGTGTWTQFSGPGTITFSNNHLATTFISGNSSGVYLLVWTENNGICTDSDTARIELHPTPVAFAGPDAIACGNTAILEADSSYTGWWTSSSTNIIYTNNINDPSPTVMTTTPLTSVFTVSFVWHVFDGVCNGADTMILTFVKPPHPEAGSPQSVCGTLAQLEADTIGSGIISAYWTCNVPGVNITYTGPDAIPWEPEVDATALGSNFWTNSQHEVYFYWNTQNGPGCTATDSVKINFYEIPEANAGPETSVCGKSITMAGDWSIDNPAGIWSTLSGPPFGNPNLIPNNVPTSFVSVNEYGDYYFIWKEMNQANSSCYDKDTILVHFLTIPMPDAGLDLSVCGLCAHICATPSVPNGQWTAPSGVAFYDTCGGNYNLNYRDSACTWIRFSSENVTITMIWAEFNGVCYGYDSVNVEFKSIQPALALVDPNDSLVCGPVYTLLNAQQPAYGSGYWMDTVLSTTFTPSPTNPSPTASIDIGSSNYYGYHHFYWITVNGPCRDTSDVVPVKFIEKPVANAGGNWWPGLFGQNHYYINTDTVCGLNYVMAAIPSIGTGIWYTEFLPSSFVNTQTTSTPVYNDSLYLICAGCYSVFNMTGDKYHEYIWQESNEICVDSDTLRLYFAPYPSGSFTTTMPACRHDSSEIIANTWNLPNNIDYGITSFSWSYTGGELSHVILNPNVSDTIYVSWPLLDSNMVSLITYNRWGCNSGMVSHYVVEPPLFNPSYIIEPTTCLQNNGEITLSTSDGTNPLAYTFHWYPAANYTNPGSITQTGLGPESNHTVEVTGQSLSPDAAPGTLCHDLISITVPDIGEVTALFDTTVFLQHQAAPYEVQFVNTSINARKYSWRIYDENGTLISISNLEEPLYTFSEPGCYKIILVATSREGCIDTVSFNPVCVDAYPVLEIPNVFTPNNDGQNDVFRVHGESIIEFHAVVYNRWGRKVYDWNDVNGSWDGKIGGAEASPGEYFYIIKAKGKKDQEYEQKGFFYLLREK